MTEDEQEALSAKYIMPRVMRLTSGRFALLVDGRSVEIVDGHTLLSRLPSYEDLVAYTESLRPPPRATGKLASLNLADIGL